MTSDRRARLAQLTTEDEMRRTMRDLLLQFGGAKQVAIAMGRGTNAHKCFVELNTPEQTMAVKDAFDGIDFGDVILISIPCAAAEPA